MSKWICPISFQHWDSQWQNLHTATQKDGLQNDKSWKLGGSIFFFWESIPQIQKPKVVFFKAASCCASPWWHPSKPTRVIAANIPSFVGRIFRFFFPYKMGQRTTKNRTCTGLEPFFFLFQESGSAKTLYSKLQFLPLFLQLKLWRILNKTSWGRRKESTSPGTVYFQSLNS